jgi:outer membrane receptor protein involved in Fe transport
MLSLSNCTWFCRTNQQNKKFRSGEIPQKSLKQLEVCGMKGKTAILLLLLILVPAMLLAQSSRVAGKVVGRLMDSETGEPLIGANVVIENTYLGASTDIDGYYQILNVPAGKYTIVFSYAGYSTKKLTDITIVPDYTTNLDETLKPEIIEGEIIVVTAERPVVQRDITASVKEVSAEEIRRSPVTNFQQMVVQQVGAVETGRGRNSGGIHIRGGRNNEIVFFVDGVNSNDPFVGAAGLNIDNNAIEQMNIITGGFNAEYGEAMSGMVQIVTKSGNAQYFTTSAEVTTDAPFSGTDLDFGYTKYFGSIDGPLGLLGKNKASFYVQANYTDTDDRNPAILPQKHNDRQLFNSTAKIKYEPIPAVLRFQVIGNISDTKEHFYSHGRSAYDFWHEQGFKNQAGDNRLSLVMTHTLSPTTWYDLTITRFETFRKYSGQNGARVNEWSALSTKLAWVSWAENQGYYNRLDGSFTGITEEEAFMRYYESLEYVHMDGDGNWVWNSPQLQLEAFQNRTHDVGYWYLDDNLDLQFRKFDIPSYNNYLANPDDPAYEDFNYAGDIDNFAYPYPRDPLGNFILNFTPRWHDRGTKYFEGEAALSSQLDKSNLVKAGGFLRMYNLNYTDIQFLNTKPYFDTYSKKPVTAAAYVQDKFEFEDFTMNAGLRFDYFDPDSKHPIDLRNLPAGFEKTKPKYQFSPRLGISFAVSSQAKMYAHYGKFFQTVDLSDLFQNLNADITNGLPILGNPDLPPQKETAYEAGFETALNQEVSLKVNAYYKDVANLLSTDQVNTLYGNSIAQYTIYKINDFSKIKGIEIELKKRMSAGLSGSVTYSFLDAKGTGSDSRDFYYLYLNTDSQLPRKEYPLDFDITHDLKARINYLIARDEGPEFMGFKPLSDLNFNFFFTWNSGAPYTPTDVKGNPLEVGSRRMPSNNRLDMRIDKYFHPSEDLELNFFIDVRNVFNIENIVNVNTFTGQPDDNGYPPIWDAANLGTYADYQKWGYASAYDMYLADVAGWERYQKDPASYGIPRIFYVGMMVKF